MFALTKIDIKLLRIEKMWACVVKVGKMHGRPSGSAIIDCFYHWKYEKCMDEPMGI